MIFQQIRNLWRLSKQKPLNDVIVVRTGSMRPEVAGELARKTGAIIVETDDVNDIKGITRQDLVQGDGKAEFLGEGTHEEFEQQEKEDKGWKGIFGL